MPNGSRQPGNWDAPSQTDLVAAVGNVAITGMPDGEADVIELVAPAPNPQPHAEVGFSAVAANQTGSNLIYPV